MSRKYKFYTERGAYFISFSVINWVDVFTRELYFNEIISSLDYCRKNKEMEIYGYCIMPSHIHLIFRAKNNNPSDIIRDFKTFTSKKIVRLIEENPQESRKEWLLWMFRKAAAKRSNVKDYQFWQQDNHPIEIWSLSVFEEKLNYIHQNPVKSGFVENTWEWKYSSAKNYCDDMSAVLEIDIN